MIFVMDLIKADNIAETANHWEEVCRFFSLKPGFISGRLLETVQTLHPQEDFSLSSIICWDTEEAWQAARRSAKTDASLANVLPKLAGKFTAFIGTLDQGSTYNPATDGGADHGDQIVVVDVIYVSEDRMKAYADMRRIANRYMSKKPGYVGACLHITTDLNSKIKYINLAEWESKDIFFISLDTPEFLEIIKEFRNDFSLYLSKVVRNIVSAPVHATAKAV